MVHRQKLIGFVLGACSLAAIGGPASAAIITSNTPVDFTGGSVSLGYDGSSHFTFSDVTGGDRFNFDAVAVSTIGDAAVTAFGPPLFSSPTPTTFFDPIRGSGVLQFGPDGFNQFASFPTPTTIPGSGVGFIIGLRDFAADGVHYGYGEFGGTNLISYGFESVAGQTITITNVSAVPLPASAPMFGAALLALGGFRYMTRRRTAAAPA